MKSSRLVSIMLMLQSRDRVSAKELAQKLEVSVRTIMRDIDALSLAGVPVYALRGSQGGIALLPGFHTDLTGMTTDESRSLFVLLSGAAHSDLGLRPALESALRKLMAAIPAAQRPEADLARRRIIIEPQAWRTARRTSGSPVDLEQLQQAVFSDRRLRVKYRRGSDGVTKDYTLDPYGLVSKAGTWYLIADHEGEPRMFRADRLLAAEQLPDESRRRAGVELEAVWDILRRSVDEVPAPLSVTVEVHKSVLPLFLRMHAYDLEKPDDFYSGRLLAVGDSVTVELRFTSIEHSLRLLAFGTTITVTAPQSVRQAIAVTAEALIARYGRGSSDYARGPRVPTKRRRES